MELAECTTKAMGTTAQVIVYAHTGRAATDLAGLALLRVSLLEQCWSRFRPDSELNRLNARAGLGPQEVSRDLEALVCTMLDAGAWTDGAFDPTVLAQMNRLGYDADFATGIAREGRAALEQTLRPVAGTDGIVVNPTAHTVILPAGVGIDPGGIGKGLAADIVADEIHAAGAQGILVNIGGDVSTRGSADGSPWVVGIQDDRYADSPVIAQVTLDGPYRAIATSSSLRRRWQGRHHVLDPRTGLPSTSDLAQVSVLAPTGWQAEAASTFALVHGVDRARQWLERESLDAFLFTHDAPPRRLQELQHA